MRTFSIITATVNALPGLEATAESLRVQTFRDFEHVVIDGGSSDGTPDWLAAQGCGIRWISEPDEGIADALNKALAMAEGEYVLVLQAGDTLLEPDSLMEASRRLAAGSEADIIAFDIIFGQGDCERRVGHRFPRARLEFKPLAHQGILFRRSMLKRTGGFDPSFRICMDYDLLLRAKRAGARIRRIGCPLTRMPADGVSSRLDWPSLRARFAEERRAQMLHCPGPLMRAVYALYWPPYLAYRRLRSVLSGAR